MLHDKTLSLRRGQTIVVSEKEKVKESFLFFGFTKLLVLRVYKAWRSVLCFQDEKESDSGVVVELK